MKINILMIVVLAVALVLGSAGCAAVSGHDLMKDVQADSWPDRANEPDGAYIASSEDFSWNLLRASMGSTGNVLISPASVYLALAMTLNGAGTETQIAMLEALSAGSMEVEDINLNSRDWSINRNSEKNFKLKIANSIWIRDGFDVAPQFLQVNADYYAAAARQLDFNGERAVDEINGWAKDATEGVIESMIDEIAPETVMFLINAIYFLADWETPFAAEDTHEGTFQTPQGDVTADFMNRLGDFDWIDSEDCEGIVLPYAGGRFAMVALLPNEGMTVREFVSKCSADVFSSLLTASMTGDGAVSFPRFETAYKTSLKPALSALGMGIAFTPEADLSLMTTSGTRNLFVGDVLHSTLIRVDEKGTEAAAVTVVDIQLTSVPQPERMIVFDRPFVYGIIDTQTNLPLFLGMLEDPSA